VVNASRSIITAWQSAINKEQLAENTADNLSAAQAARNAAVKMRDEIKEELS